MRACCWRHTGHRGNLRGIGLIAWALVGHRRGRPGRGRRFARDLSRWPREQACGSGVPDICRRRNVDTFHGCLAAGLQWAAFGAGASLWAASLVMVSIPKILPIWVRVVGIAAAVLFSIVGVELFLGQPLNALSKPLPFFAYPLLALTMFGWAWAHYRAEA